MIFSGNLFTKQIGMHEKKIEKLWLLCKHSIWRSWIYTTLKEMKAFLGVVINMGMNRKCDIKKYFSIKWPDRMQFFS